MAKPPQRLFQHHSQFLGLLRSHINRLHFHDKPSISLPAGGSLSPSSAIRGPDPLSTTLCFSSRVESFQIQSKRLSKPYPIPPIFSSGFGARLYANSSGLRYFSSGGWNLGKAQTNANFPKAFLDLPLRSLRSAFYRYREAVGLQIEAFWKRNYVFLLGAGGVVLCVVLWRAMFGIATTFVGLSEGMAKYGFLALSASIVAFSGLYIRSRLTINPDKVYRIAMRKLNTSAGILEVMGAPLTGTDLRAYVMSGGGLSLKKFKPTLRSKRCFLIFPIRGSERRGLVSIEVKKKKGEYDMKLLAVDIPMATGPDQRLFLIGDEEEYKVGGGLISELRDPVVKAMAATKEFEELDQIEEEEDAERELQEAERKHREEIEKLEKGAPQ
ncbi:hypothetical protein CK203_038133 [Vitis vinifera]|uniref:Import inner membrane translocase subunit n=1 Tax=Vitis vinifera TaxID=29760 RepID=A0A438HAA1_VITVI|nr:hypothetical protein CK203_038133 [Vitis vinifera]